MGHQHRNEGNDENDLKNGFCRSNEQLRFNLDRIIQKYENMEVNGKCSGVEIDLDGNVYYPVDMPRSRLDRTLKKLINRNENFGLSAFAAEDNSAEIFGKQFKQRLKECRKLDHEFDQRFKSRHPGWRPYTTPRKSRVERTVIRKTVKELTFENSIDYLNYLMKVKHIPADVFRQQEIAYINRMALPSTELEVSRIGARLGETRTIRSRSASPCTSTERRNIAAPSSLMLTGDSCIRSRECSPSTVTSHLPNDGPTSSQIKDPVPLMFLADSCNKSRDCSPSTSRLYDNDDFFASSACQNSRTSSNGALDQNRAKITYLSSEANSEAENSFSLTNGRFGKDDISDVWQNAESYARQPEERKKPMTLAQKRLEFVQKQNAPVTKEDGRYSPLYSECTRTSSTSARKMDSKSPSARKNDARSASSVVVDSASFNENREESTEFLKTNGSAVTPSSKMMPTLSAVGSAKSKASNSGKKSRERKSLKTPTASKSRRSNSQKKSPESNMVNSTKGTVPLKEIDPHSTPKTLPSVDSSASNTGKNSRKRKSSQTPKTASKKRISSQKKSPEDSVAKGTEAVVSSKRAKAQTTPKTLLSADSHANSNVSRSRKRNSSHSQQTPTISRLRTRAQKLPSSPASTPLTTKKRIFTSKPQTPHAAATIASSKNESNSFETPMIVESQASVTPGSKSKKRTSKTPKNVESQPDANPTSQRRKKEEKVAKTDLIRTIDVNMPAEKENSTLTKRKPRIPAGNNKHLKNKKVVSVSAKITAKALRTLRSRTKTSKTGTVQKLPRKSNKSKTTSEARGKRMLSAKLLNEISGKIDEHSKKSGGPENASISLQSPQIHRCSPMINNSQKLSASAKSGKRRSDDSDFERVVTPLKEETIAFDFWNGNVSSVVQSYDENFMNFGKPTTILGFDAGDIRQNCREDAQQSTLSVFLNCARKYSLSEAESVSVDGAMKEDRRAMAAARNRNRQLISGYYV